MIKDLKLLTNKREKKKGRCLIVEKNFSKGRERSKDFKRKSMSWKSRWERTISKQMLQMKGRSKNHDQKRNQNHHQRKLQTPIKKQFQIRLISNMMRRVLPLKKGRGLQTELLLERFPTQGLLLLKSGLKKVPLPSVVFSAYTKLVIQLDQELNTSVVKQRNLAHKMLWNFLMEISSKTFLVIFLKTISLNILSWWVKIRLLGVLELPSQHRNNLTLILMRTRFPFACMAHSLRSGIARGNWHILSNLVWRSVVIKILRKIRDWSDGIEFIIY